MDFSGQNGANLDTAHFYYKERWASEIRKILGRRPDLEGILASQDPDIVQKAEQLKTRFGLEIETMKRIQDNLGPFDWRLPESQAIYWAWIGLENAHQGQRNFLRRIIWQSMALRLSEVVSSKMSQLKNWNMPQSGLSALHPCHVPQGEGRGRESRLLLHHRPGAYRVPPKCHLLFLSSPSDGNLGALLCQSLRSAFQTHCPQA